jgi:hypothetical protein
MYKRAECCSLALSRSLALSLSRSLALSLSRSLALLLSLSLALSLSRSLSLSLSCSLALLLSLSLARSLSLSLALMPPVPPAWPCLRKDYSATVIQPFYTDYYTPMQTFHVNLCLDEYYLSPSLPPSLPPSPPPPLSPFVHALLQLQKYPTKLTVTLHSILHALRLELEGEKKKNRTGNRRIFFPLSPPSFFVRESGLCLLLMSSDEGVEGDSESEAASVFVLLYQ